MSVPAHLAIVGVALLSVVQAAAAAPSALAGSRWTNRLVVVSAPVHGDPRIAEQRRIVRAAQAGFRERDLRLVEAIGPGREAVAIRRELGLADDGFEAVLVGKDGGVKLKRAEPIPAERLFTEIDAMPMRRDEMARTRR